ncbi:uncharacterized protein LOC126203644 [Schistocerca nitens]|uniref:uncharacterized protein LOC126203644 n=1 Tax=Schistocerca nitens TaxID=7011 RepID=UPI0021173B3D|nr:uncharacterized protein LOC126203644 [Schistocerca nitens]
MEERMRSRLDKPVTLHFGPYWAWGTMKHRIQRLYGLITKLEELGYNVRLDPYDIWDQLEITVNEVIIFKCRQTFLKYNCEHDEDPVCRRAVEAVTEMYPKIITAALAVEKVEELPPESHPAVAVLYDLINSLPLPETPVEEVLRTLLESLPLIDTIPESIIYSLLKTLWLSDSVPEGMILELVRKIPTYAPDAALSALMESVMQSAAKYPPHAILREMLRRLPIPTKCKCREKKQPPPKMRVTPMVCTCKSLSEIEVSDIRISETGITERARSETAISEMRISGTGIIEMTVSETRASETEEDKTDKTKVNDEPEATRHVSWVGEEDSP